MRRLWLAIFARPSPDQDNDELKQIVETKRRELNGRSDRNRGRLAEIMVDVIARRNDTDAR